MKHAPDRRTILRAAGAAAVVAAISGAGIAGTMEINGTVTFEGGTLIPEGELEIYLEDAASAGDASRRVARTLVASDGGAKAIDFVLAPSESV